jgi:hypothetical protein
MPPIITDHAATGATACRTTLVSTGRRTSAPDDGRQNRTTVVRTGRRSSEPDDERQWPAARSSCRSRSPRRRPGNSRLRPLGCELTLARHSARRGGWRAQPSLPPAEFRTDAAGRRRVEPARQLARSAGASDDGVSAGRRPSEPDDGRQNRTTSVSGPPLGRVAGAALRGDGQETRAAVRSPANSRRPATPLGAEAGGRSLRSLRPSFRLTPLAVAESSRPANSPDQQARRTTVSAPDDGRQNRTTVVRTGRRSSEPDDERQNRTTDVRTGRRTSEPDDVRQSQTMP